MYTSQQKNCQRTSKTDCYFKRYCSLLKVASNLFICCNFLLHINCPSGRDVAWGCNVLNKMSQFYYSLALTVDTLKSFIICSPLARSSRGSTCTSLLSYSHYILRQTFNHRCIHILLILTSHFINENKNNIRVMKQKWELLKQRGRPR